jgi:glyoxylase I family protein
MPCRSLVLCLLTLMLGGCMHKSSSPAAHAAAPTAEAAVVRYQVTDVDRSLAFYTQQLGFAVDQRTGPVFARVSRGALALLLSGPGSSGSRALPDGRRQEPGGWNRIVLYVDDLDAQIDRLRRAAVRFRNQVEAGPGGTQIQIDDPDGNPIELHQAPPTTARSASR